MIMKRHALTSHESRMCPIDFGVKRSKALMIEKCFRTITDPVIHLWSWDFMHLLLMSQGCILLISGSKGQGHGALMIENGFWTITDPVIHLWSWNFMHLLSMSQGCTLLISGSKGHGHWGINYWKWFPDHNWPCNPPMIMTRHALAPYESRMYLLISESKGQRSRSRGIDYWKRIPEHNWPCNPPKIMKLHALTPHESRMCSIDFEVKRSRSWGIVNCKWFPDHKRLCHPLMIMKLHTHAPHESRMCPIDFGVKRSKVKVMGHWLLKTVSGP